MKNFLKILSVILLTGIIFSACQKEYDVLDGAAATGTLKEDASGDCMPVTINGIYTANTNVGSGNFADIQVNIDNIGTYDIKTDTVNGYYFRGTGSVAITGVNTIRLQAGGKPIISGTDIFKVKFSGTTCELNVSVVAGTTSTAVFTLVAASTGAACTGATQAGAYNQGLATSSSNTATVFANVTTAGTYNITTTNVNGVSFSGAGSLTVGTNQPIVLTANGGTPTAAGTFNYPVTAGASSCNFNIVYGAALPQAVLTPNCTGATANGTYQAGTAMTTANTITIPVLVTTAGTYTATAASQNGVSFSGSGTVTTSSTSITLTASATTPTAAGTFTYPVTLNGSPVCSVSVTYTTASTSTAIIKAKINGSSSFTTFNEQATAGLTSGFGFSVLTIGGKATPTGQELINFDITSFSAITTGTYDVNQLIPVVTSAYTDASGNGYEASTDGTTQTNPFTIIIDAISATHVTGRFSGKLTAMTGTGTIVFTEGSFDLPLQ